MEYVFTTTGIKEKKRSGPRRHLLPRRADHLRTRRLRHTRRPRVNGHQERSRMAGTVRGNGLRCARGRHALRECCRPGRSAPRSRRAVRHGGLRALPLHGQLRNRVSRGGRRFEHPGPHTVLHPELPG